VKEIIFPLRSNLTYVRFQVLTAASMMFRVVFWDILPCKMIVPDYPIPSSLMMEAVRTSETSVDNHFTRQYIPEDNSEQNTPYILPRVLCREMLRHGTDCCTSPPKEGVLRSFIALGRV
jgi:hypothetical protein